MSSDFGQPTPVQLSRKHRAFLHVYIETGDPGKAALDSGLIRKTTHPHDASLAGAEILRELQPQLVVLMDAFGLSDRVILKGVLEGTSACIQRVITRKGKKLSDGTQEPDYIDVVTTTVPNWPVRKFYHRMASEMKALVDPKERAAAEQSNAGRVSSIDKAHRMSLSGKTDDELRQIQTDEVLRRQGVRRAVS